MYELTVCQRNASAKLAKSRQADKQFALVVQPGWSTSYTCDGLNYTIIQHVVKNSVLNVVETCSEPAPSFAIHIQPNGVVHASVPHHWSSKHDVGRGSMTRSARACSCSNSLSVCGKERKRAFVRLDASTFRASERGAAQSFQHDRCQRLTECLSSCITSRKWACPTFAVAYIPDFWASMIPTACPCRNHYRTHPHAHPGTRPSTL